uniref:AIG1-type G domain-containing protein n=1 Tax=Lates calcarifer TaxID=8187 RepID=A0A4W6EES2_LATCA
MSCITECAPGPHAFLIVLKVDRFTEHEQAVITKILQYFSEDALKYAVVVFTHGEDLTGGKTIQEFVSKNKNLSDLVKKCGGRCHVFDNKHWNKQQNNYRSNQFQVEDLLNTVDKMVMKNNGGYYTNMVLQEVEEEIKKEEEQIKQSSEKMPQEVIRQQAKANDRFLIQMTGFATGALLGAFLGVPAMIRSTYTTMRTSTELIRLLKYIPAVGMTAAAVVGGGEVAIIAAGALAGVAPAARAGGTVGQDAAKAADTAWGAAKMAAKAVINNTRRTT